MFLPPAGPAVRLGQALGYLEEQLGDGDAVFGVLGRAGGDEIFEAGGGIVAGGVAAPVG